jgi:hypothetical protein
MRLAFVLSMAEELSAHQAPYPFRVEELLGPPGCRRSFLTVQKDGKGLFLQSAELGTSKRWDSPDVMLSRLQKTNIDLQAESKRGNAVSHDE